MSELNPLNCPAWYQGAMQPIAGDLPCGENLEYNTDFIMLQDRLQPRLGAEYGDFVEAAEPINWSEIERNCLGLLTKAKDIRLLITLIRCRMRQTGVEALAEGLQVLLLALEQWPEELHPQLYDEGEFEPLLRANAFSEMEAPDGFLADFRQLSLPKAAGIQISIRDFEKANAWPREEGALTEATLAGIQNEWSQLQSPAILSLQQAFQYLKTLKTQLADSLGYEAADFSQLLKILQYFSTAPLFSSAAEATSVEEQAATDSEPDIVDAETVAAPSVPVAVPANMAINKPGAIDSRTEALNQLRAVREWLTKFEPSSPAIALLSLTEQTIGKNFLELLKILPPELITKLEAEQGA